MNKKIILFVINLLFLFASFKSFGKDINISSDHLKVDRSEGISEFTGSVYSKDEELEIWSDKLFIFYNDEMNKIMRIEALGNVKLERNNLIATGKKAEYFINKDEAVISDNVVLIQGGNEIYCERLFIDLAESTSIMESKNNKRVRAKIKKVN